MNEQDNLLLDTITLTDNQTYYGIVDYVNRKHVAFYDLSYNNNAMLSIALIYWRIHEPETRFTLFILKNRLKINLPFISYISKKDIIDSNIDINAIEQQPDHRKRPIKMSLDQ